MIAVTGGLGFIGSNLIKYLNKKGYNNIIIVDNIDNKGNYRNFEGLVFKSFLSPKDFVKYIENNYIEYIFHLGACSSTTETNGQFLYENNFKYSISLIEYAKSNNIPIAYASSASVYGLGDKGFKEDNRIESPLNLYASSKFLVDNYVRNLSNTSLVMGLRFFNVFGPAEKHKGEMQSVIGKFLDHIKSSNSIQLFKGSEKIIRDFIYVEDVCKVCYHFFKNPSKGLFNVGTGVENSFMDIYDVINAKIKNIKLEEIPFPEHLLGKYQYYTIADISKLRDSGYSNEFLSLEEGILEYSKSYN